MSSHVSPVDAGEISHAEEDAALRGAPVRIAAVSLFVTACLLALKLTLGLLSGSIAVLSDAVDSGTDLVGGAAALFSVRVSRMPEDEEHPFGHGKIEAVSAAVAATVIALGGGLVTYQAVRRLVEGSPEIHVGVGLIAMSVAVVANVVMTLFMRREANRSHSMALGADYNILLMSRLREETREGVAPREAAARAVELAGPTVASAAIILAGTFGSLMLTGVDLLSETGFAVAAGIVLVAIVMVTGRRSENGLYHLLRERGTSVEMIGDATAPRSTYEAVFEGHRQARKL